MTITIDEPAFLDLATEFLRGLRGPEQGTVDPDLNLITESGLDSLQLVALLRFIEDLRQRELSDVPPLGELTLRRAYQMLYAAH